MKRYPVYKDSGVRWIGEVPNEWDTLKIKWLSPVKRGASPRPIDDPKYFDDDGEFSWVRIADVTASERYLERTTQTLSELGSSLSVKRYPGDFFVSIAGTVGKPIITKIKCCIHDGFVYFPLLRMNPEFLYYMFSAGELFNGLGKWGTQLNLNTETVGDINVPLPSDSETEKILKHLDHKTNLIDTLIEKKQKQIELLQEQRAAIINQAVTKGLNPNVKMKDSGIEWLGEVPDHWEVKPFKHCCGIAEGQVDPKADGFKDYILIAPNHIESGTGRLLFTETADKQGAISGKYRVNSGDIVYSKIRPALNKICLSNEECLCSADMYPIKTRPEMASKFLLYFMLSETFVRLMVNESMRVAMPKINRDTLRNYALPVPLLDEQSQIVNEIDRQINEIFMLNKRLSLTIERLKEYRTTLISEVVTGKVDVRDEVIP